MPRLPSEVFRWDAAPNLVSSDHPGGFVEHNRLKMFEDKRFEYDVYARLVRKLRGHGPAKELALEYDAFGQRIRKLNGGICEYGFSVGRHAALAGNTSRSSG